MGNDSDLKKHFEAITGHELIGDMVNEIVTREIIGVYYQTEAGHRTSRDIGTTGDSTKACGDVKVLTIGGVVVTGRDGTTERLLSEFHCASNRAQTSVIISILRPFVLVATPRSKKPVFVTTRTSLVQTNNLGDVRMQFSAWSAGGDPAARISVAWHCIAAYEQFFVIDD
ncbi:MAG: hypothetical protein ACC700_15405 [Anaerolineales bacterium]